MSAAKKVFMENLGRRIAALRLEKGLTQTQLAVLLGEKGLDRQVITRLEQGANPTIYTLIQLAKALGVTLNDMVDFDRLEK
jgi:transcriptional regulator with XRE-family HTH domain